MKYAVRELNRKTNDVTYEELRQLVMMYASKKRVDKQKAVDSSGMDIGVGDFLSTRL